jgi:hypothetical protein
MIEETGVMSMANEKPCSGVWRLLTFASPKEERNGEEGEKET